MSLCLFCPYDLWWEVTSSKEEPFLCHLQPSVQPSAAPGYSKILTRMKEKKQVPVDKYQGEMCPTASYLWNQMCVGARKVTHPKTKVLIQVQFTHTWKKKEFSVPDVSIPPLTSYWKSQCFPPRVISTMPETIKIKLNSDMSSLVIESYLNPCWASICKLSSLGFLPTDGGNQMWWGWIECDFYKPTKLKDTC